MRKSLLLQRSCCIGHLASAVCQSPRGAALMQEMQQSCPRAAGAKLCIHHLQRARLCRLEALLQFPAMQPAHAFHQDFPQLSFRYKCTDISAGTVPLSPAGPSVSPPSAEQLPQTPAWLFLTCSPGCCAEPWGAILPGPSPASNLRPALRCLAQSHDV